MGHPLETHHCRHESQELCCRVAQACADLQRGDQSGRPYGQGTQRMLLANVQQGAFRYLTNLPTAVRQGYEVTTRCQLESRQLQFAS